MKKYLTLLIFFCSTVTFSNSKVSEFEYSIIFIGYFENDIVSLSINNTLVIDKYKIANADSSIKGNLSLTQSEREIKIYYNGGEISKSKIEVDFMMQVDVTINNKLNRYKIDRRKGKVILIDNYLYANQKQSNKKKIKIEQLQEPMMLIADY